MSTNDYIRQSAQKYNWYTVECMKDERVRTIEDIHEEIYQEIRKHI